METILKDYKYCVVDFVNCINHYCRDEKEVDALIRKLKIPESLYWVKPLHKERKGVRV